MRAFSTDGVAQSERMLVGLRDNYVVPFEMDFSHLLVLLTDLARHFRYPTVNGDELSWADFFQHNEVVITARIGALDLAGALNDFEFAIGDSVAAAQSNMLAFVAQIESWGNVVPSAISEKDAVLLKVSIESLMVLNQSAQVSEADLRQAFERIIASVRALRNGAGKYLQHCLSNSTQEPASGLVFTFLQLLGDVARHANSFTSRHLDFYYKKVLGGELRPGIADSTFVHFAANGDVDELLVPAGTTLLGGKEQQGKEINFETKMNLRVNAMQVSSLCTLFFEREKLISPERELGYVTRIHGQKLTFEKQFVSEVPRLPIFGAYLPTDHHRRENHNNIGFALGSSVMRAAHGHRAFTLRLQLGTRFENNTAVKNALYDIQHGQTRGYNNSKEDMAFSRQRVLKLFMQQIGVLNNAVTVKRGSLAYQRRMQHQKRLLLNEISRSQGNVAQTYRNLLLCMVREAGDLDEFYTRLGWFIGPYFIGRSNWLTLSVKSELLEIGGRFNPAWRGSALRLHKAGGISRMEALQNTERVFDEQILRLLLNDQADSDDEYVLHFYHLFRRLFTIQLTTDQGWMDVANWKIEPVRREHICELRLQFELDADAPQVVDFDADLHGGNFASGKPVCRLLVNDRNNFFAYSSLVGMLLFRADIDLTVQGISDLHLQCDTGPLDPSKPFMPFGAMPVPRSVMVIGCREAAPKRVSRFGFELAWKALPDDLDGFATYFRQYPQHVTNEDFKVQLEVLELGRWQPVSQEPLRLLFGGNGQLAPSVRFSFAVDPSTFATDEYADKPFVFSPVCRSGFFRLVLVSPDQAFGARTYADAFARVTAANVKRRWRRLLPLPQQPFLLTCEQISADYTASASLDLSRANDPQTTEEPDCYHVHPFGETRITRTGSSDENWLLPHYEADGNLFIGLTNNQNARSVDLFFDIDDKMVSTSVADFAPNWWSYLSGAGWRELPAECLVLDSTVSFHRSGVVSLLLPDDVAPHAAMPGEQIWLRVSTNSKIEKFGKIRQVATQVVEVQRVAHAPSGVITQPNWRPLNNIPGVLHVQQLGIHYGQRDEETDAQFRTRMSERLRHKNRALSPWDYERLVLQEFPEIFKVKCLQHAEPRQAGIVTVVVVADDPQPELAGRTAFPRASAVRLKQIQDFLRARAPAYVRVRVVNPGVDAIQVRCTVRFKETYRRGEFREQLDGDISRYLWPWTAHGYTAGFDWSIRLSDVKRFIRELDYVDFVTEFSMLRMAEDAQQKKYALVDSGRQPLQVIHASRDDCIAAPMEGHFIRILDEDQAIAPEGVGVGDLRINRTFLVDSSVGASQDSGYA